MCKVRMEKSCSFKILKMHALNSLTAVVVSANMAYLACTISLTIKHAKPLVGLLTCTLSVAGTDTVKGALPGLLTFCYLT